MECRKLNTENPCPLLRIFDGEAFCGASHELEGIIPFGENEKETSLPLKDGPAATCPNRIVERSFHGQEKVMCCERTKKPIVIGRNLLTNRLYKKALNFVVMFSGSAEICPECVFRAILGIIEPYTI